MKRRYTIILLVVALVCTAVTAQTDQDTSRKYDAFFLEAINQRVKGNNDAAFDLLRHCVDIDSTKSEAWYFLAQYYDALKENDEAQRCVEKAASLDPDISTYQEILANLYLSKQDYPKAIEVLNRIYEANHDREDVLGALVSIYEDQQDYKSAIQTLNRLEVMEGRSPQFSLKKSGYYTQLGNKKAAIHERKILTDQQLFSLKLLCLRCGQNFIIDQLIGLIKGFDHLGRFRMEIDLIQRFGFGRVPDSAFQDILVDACAVTKAGVGMAGGVGRIGGELPGKLRFALTIFVVRIRLDADFLQKRIELAVAPVLFVPEIAFSIGKERTVFHRGGMASRVLSSSISFGSSIGRSARTLIFSSFIVCLQIKTGQSARTALKKERGASEDTPLSE